MEEFMDKETCVAFYEDAKVNARHSRIEARFEKLLVAVESASDDILTEDWDYSQHGFERLWHIANKAESFLESKRAEVKDGK